MTSYKHREYNQDFIETFVICKNLWSQMKGISAINALMTDKYT